MSWAAVIVGGSMVVSAGINYMSQNSAADAQSEAMDKATAAEMEMQEKAIAAQLEASGMSAEAIKEAARTAAEAQRDNTRKAIESQLRLYEDARKVNLPWVKAGEAALHTLQNKMEAGPGEFEESPGYKFRLKQGEDTVLSRASATGGLASGRTLKALTEYGQDYASNEYDKFLDRYYQSLVPYQFLTQMGQGAAAMQSAQSMQLGSSLAGSYRALGSGLSATAMAQGSSLANIYNQRGINQASGYTNMGNIMGNNYIQQGNISANDAIAKGNIESGLVQNLGSLFASGFGSQSGAGGGIKTIYGPPQNQNYYYPQNYQNYYYPQNYQNTSPKWV
jgi:hypothetical protein